jgi:hypothetical protein
MKVHVTHVQLKELPVNTPGNHHRVKTQNLPSPTPNLAGSSHFRVVLLPRHQACFAGFKVPLTGITQVSFTGTWGGCPAIPAELVSLNKGTGGTLQF